MWPKYGKSSTDIRDCTVVTVRMSFITFCVRNSAEDIYTDDFEIERSELQRLKRHITGRDDTFRQHAEAFHAELEKIGMDTDRFIAVLDNLINDSDQSDDFIHVSWF